MRSFRDARPQGPRGALSISRGSLANLLALFFAMATTWGSPAHARAFDVPCDPLALANAKIAAGANGEEDFLWLAPGCVYELIDSWIADPDGGFPVTIHGRGAIFSGKDLRRAFIVPAGATLYLNDLRITDGFTTADGGAIHNAGAMTLTKTTVSDSAARTGGGIYNAENAALTLIASTVSGNTASEDGGGILNRKGRLTLIGTTVSGNSAQGASGNGGGIFNGRQGSRATLTNSTVSGNASRFGAGVFNDEAVMAVSQSTISHNLIVGGGNGGGIYFRNYFGSGKLQLGNSIVANSLVEAGGGYDCARDPFLDTNVVTPTGGNLIEDGSCQVAGALSGDPGLGDLTGVPAYRPLLPGSPAVDRGQNPSCAGVDQRGAARPKDGDGNGSVLCDLGAHEAP